MKLLVSSLSLAALLAAASICCLAVEQQVVSNTQQQQAQPQVKQQVVETTPGRQGRSIASSSSGNSAGGSSSNNLSSSGSQLNVIDHSSGKSRLEQEKRAVQEFLTTKNIVKSIVKLLFGNQDEVSATSRNVLGVLSKVLDLLKNTFGQKSRSGTARTIRDSAEEAASAGVSMVQGYVKSVLANDGQCAKRYLCQASREAIRDGRDLGYVIATVGSYASSYMLDSTKSNGFNTFYDASLKGRSAKEDCVKIYPDCAE